MNTHTYTQEYAFLTEPHVTVALVSVGLGSAVTPTAAWVGVKNSSASYGRWDFWQLNLSQSGSLAIKQMKITALHGVPTRVK